MAKKVQKKAKSKRQRARGGSDWRPAFLAAYVQTGIEIDACEAVPVAVSTVWKERKRNPEFAALYEEARQMGALLLVKEATRRAQHGVQKLKFYEGTVIVVPDPSGKMQFAADGSPILDDSGRHLPAMVPYIEHEYSDTLLTLLLKRHFPAEFREKPPEVNVNATASAVAGISDADLAAAQERRKHYLESLAAPKP